VLFLDELPEFSRAACEALRQPLEDGEVTVWRAMTSVRFPARFALIAAANPCPCGHLGDTRFACRCSLYDLHRYASRLSGPLLDRIDLYVQAERLTAGELAGAGDGEPTAPVRAGSWPPAPSSGAARASRTPVWHRPPSPSSARSPRPPAAP
jgi:magnesium chelatase family protein